MAKADTQLRKLVRETPLAELVDVGVLQRMQDRFAEVTGVSVVIRDLQGRPVTRPSCQNAFCSLMTGSQYGETCCRESNRRAVARAAEEHRVVKYVCHAGLSQFAAPIEVETRLRRDDRHRRPAGRPGLGGAHRPTGAPQRHPGEKTPRRAQHRPALVGRGDDPRDHAARLGHQQRRGPLLPGRGTARQAARDQHALRGQQAPRRNARPDQLLKLVAKSATEAAGAKGCSIRLLDAQGKRLVIKSFYNLSQRYLDKGPVLVERSEIDRAALKGEVVQIFDMLHDPRVRTRRKRRPKASAPASPSA